jgi:MFS transporter, BCD family, chlorophyll transporter
LSLVQRTRKLSAGFVPRIDWTRVATRYLPFADAASADLPLAQLLRLTLFQVSVGAATALMIGTLNRVMIVELGVGAWLVASMVALPMLVAPFRALVGWRSDAHRSVLGWRRVPFMGLGTLLLFGGLAIMPFALILLTGATAKQQGLGHAAAALAFLMAGAGLQTTQTAGLALATDLAAPGTRSRVVALMYAMLLVGMVVASLIYGVLLADYSHTRLVQVVQGTAVVCVLLNAVALWKQEPRQPRRLAGQATAEGNAASGGFAAQWRRFTEQPRVKRYLVVVGLGTLAFNMQDVILEPYGGEVLGLGVGATTQLTAIMAVGALLAFGWAARLLGKGLNPHRVSAIGLLFGIVGFSAVIFAEPMASPLLYRLGAAVIGLGGGLFSVGTLYVAMSLDRGDAAPVSGLPSNGLVIGAWGAVQATSAGLAVALGGVLRDTVSVAATQGLLGDALNRVGTGYIAVYHLELALLFVTLIALGPLVSRAAMPPAPAPSKRPFGMVEFPG